MTGGSLPAQTWHDIMVVAHEGVEVKDIAGIEVPPKPTIAAAQAQKDDDAKPAPPPVLTRRGAEILVRIEKMLDEASKTAGKTSAADPVVPTTTGFAKHPDNVATAAGDIATTPARKN